MRLRLLPSAHPRASAAGGALPAQPLTSYVVEGAGGAGPLVIDAGSVGLVGEPQDMARARGLVLTHAHIDHVASLPMWVEALLSLDRAPVRVHASDGAIAALRAHLFSGALFPDFEALAEPDGRPLMELVPFPVEEEFEVAGFRLRAFEVNHPVPTHGLFVDDGEDAIVFGADSGPTERLWQIAREAERVRAVVLETSFPNRMQAIADGSGHLTAATLATEIAKAPERVRVLVAHLKPAYRVDVAAEIQALGTRPGGRFELLQPDFDVQVTRADP
ncbi:MAG: MBL fold metallo-hydrolase [Planctomycetota bacterium]